MQYITIAIAIVFMITVLAIPADSAEHQNAITDVHVHTADCIH